MNPDHLSLSQIAEALNVLPSTLSQWQKRYKEDFPEHVEKIGERRFYLLADIEAFATRHDFSIGETKTRLPSPIWDTANILRATNASIAESAVVIAFFACLWSHQRSKLQVIFKAGSDALKIVENPLLMDGREVVEGLKLSESQIHQIAHIWLEKTPVASDDEREKIAKKLRIQIASPLDKSGPISTTSQSLAKLINKIGRGL
jgi:transcriptional regulator with XRE-family HTH domain